MPRLVHVMGLRSGRILSTTTTAVRWWWMMMMMMMDVLWRWAMRMERTLTARWPDAFPIDRTVNTEHDVNAIVQRDPLRGRTFPALLATGSVMGIVLLLLQMVLIRCSAIVRTSATSTTIVLPVDRTVRHPGRRIDRRMMMMVVLVLVMVLAALLAFQLRIADGRIGQALLVAGNRRVNDARRGTGAGDDVDLVLTATPGQWWCILR